MQLPLGNIHILNLDTLIYSTVWINWHKILERLAPQYISGIKLCTNPEARQYNHCKDGLIKHLISLGY
jgi:hypothetical protein